jgi:acyl-CoA dehydrogenase
MEILARYGTRSQQERWLLPLLRGEIRSCFAMTEPAVASSDATNLEARVDRIEVGERRGGHVVHGRKWWTSGAMDTRCSLCIFIGRAAPLPANTPPHRRHTMILLPLGSEGVKVMRPLTVFGYDDAPHGHAEVDFNNVYVPAGGVLLGEGRGFEIAQGRLGPGRLHHCMRLIGMGERAIRLMKERAAARVVFGKPIADQGAFQHALAEARITLDSARLLVLRAADALDRRGFKGARGEIAAAKVAAPRAALAVIDQAMQVHGGAGVSGETPLAYLYAGARTLRIADGPDEVHLETLAKVEMRARL